MRDGRGLAKLLDDAFSMMVNGKVNPSYVAIVGQLAPDKATHADMLGIIARADPDNLVEAESIVRAALSAPAVQETMTDLFGSSETTQILYKERAQILSSAATAIRKDRAAFNTLVKEEDRIAGAGNKLVSAKNAERATEDAKLLATLQATARRKGPVADALAVAAQRLHEGQSLQQATKGFLDNLRGKAPDAETGSAQGHQRKPAGKSDKPSALKGNHGPTRTEFDWTTTKLD